jgi:hypothetical protein
LKDLASKGRDVKQLADLTATENLRQLLEESAGRRTAAGQAQPKAVPQQGSLILYGDAEDIVAVKELLKRLRGKVSAALKVRQTLEQAEQYQDASDEQFLLCYLSALRRTIGEE